jgi:hypothetical protein
MFDIQFRFLGGHFQSHRSILMLTENRNNLSRFARKGRGIDRGELSQGDLQTFRDLFQSMINHSRQLIGPFVLDIGIHWRQVGLTGNKIVDVLFNARSN